MVHKQKAKISCRRFFEGAALLISGCGLLPRSLNAEEPFDAVPPNAWKNQRRNGLIMICRPAPGRLGPTTRIVSNSEPGQPLLVQGQVFAPDGITPVEDLTVYAYNTDAHGYYGENQKEYPPRLYGWMKTDSSGKFELRTIRPGWYPNMHIPAHVHLTVWGAGYPLQWVEELRFKGDPYLTSSTTEEDAQRGEFRTIREVSRSDDGMLRCSLKIRVERESNFR